SRIVPGPFVVTKSGVKYTAPPFFFDPGPGFTVISFYPFHQDVDIVRYFSMYICFVPGGEWGDTDHDGMVRISNLGGKSSCIVRHKLSSDHVHHFNRISETITGTMYGNESLTASHIVQKCCFLSCGN